jgi:hypothetical protein
VVTRVALGCGVGVVVRFGGGVLLRSVTGCGVIAGGVVGCGVEIDTSVVIPS